MEEKFGGEKDLSALGEGEEMKLFGGSKFTIWELRELQEVAKEKYLAEENYEKLLRKVAWFDNIGQFHQVWNKLPHSRIKDILADSDNNRFRV